MPNRSSQFAPANQQQANSSDGGVTIALPEADGSERAKVETGKPSRKSRRKIILDPSGTLYYHWSVVVSFAFLYNFWSLSYRFAFREIDDSTVILWFALDYSADLVYILDLVVNHRTGYLEDGVLQKSLEKISQHYRESTLFYLDCLCLLPLDVLYLSIGFNSILRCSRLVKIYKFWSYVDRTERHTNYPNVFRTFTLVHYILVIFHWNACLFHMINKNKILNIQSLYKMELNECNDILCQYLYAFYWSTLALTTIGDLPQPKTKGEYFYVTIELFFGLFLFASVLGHVANIVTNVSAARKEFQAKLDTVKTFMRMRRVSEELQNKVIRWFDYLWVSQKSSDEERSVACLPDRLKAEIAIHVHLDTLKRVDIFQNTEAGFLCELVLRLKPVLFSPGDYVCRKNEVGHEMYIVSRGILEVVTDGGLSVVATLKAGSYFGEISVLNVGQAGNKRTASVRSVGYSDLFCLNKQDLWDVLKNYPNAEARIRARAEERLSKLELGGSGAGGSGSGGCPESNTLLQSDNCEQPTSGNFCPAVCNHYHHSHTYHRTRPRNSGRYPKWSTLHPSHTNEWHWRAESSPTMSDYQRESRPRAGDSPARAAGAELVRRDIERGRFWSVADSDQSRLADDRENSLEFESGGAEAAVPEGMSSLSSWRHPSAFSRHQCCLYEHRDSEQRAAGPSSLIDDHYRDLCHDDEGRSCGSRRRRRRSQRSYSHSRRRSGRVYTCSSHRCISDEFDQTSASKRATRKVEPSLLLPPEQQPTTATQPSGSSSQSPPALWVPVGNQQAAPATNYSTIPYLQVPVLATPDGMLHYQMLPGINPQTQTNAPTMTGSVQSLLSQQQQQQQQQQLICVPSGFSSAVNQQSNNQQDSSSVSGRFLMVGAGNYPSSEFPLSRSSQSVSRSTSRSPAIRSVHGGSYRAPRQHESNLIASSKTRSAPSADNSLDSETNPLLSAKQQANSTTTAKPNNSTQDSCTNDSTYQESDAKLNHQMQKEK